MYEAYFINENDKEIYLCVKSAGNIEMFIERPDSNSEWIVTPLEAQELFIGLGKVLNAIRPGANV